MFNINYKKLKVVLILEMKKLNLVFLILNLDKFPFFDNFFPNLANFWDLNNFLLFEFFNLDNFSNFGFINFLINLSLFLTLSFLLVANILLIINIYNNIIIFSININHATILLNP